MTLSRRHFLHALVLSAGTGMLRAEEGSAQQAGTMQDGRKTMSGPMNETAYKPVSRPPKAHAGPLLTTTQRDELEHRIHCQCGCTLDVYTCRTTDFTCAISPAMHNDIMQLVAGGHSAEEIIAAFRDVYGEKVLMAPPREGFNWAGYLTPFVTLGVGATVVALLIRKWKPPTAPGAAATIPPTSIGVTGTPDELARLDAAIRDDTL